MARMALLLSPERCIGCRGCQTACKEWNQLPGTKTFNSGSVENPPDLTPHLYNRIKYAELPSDKDKVRWLFVSQRCMHCEEAGCMIICPTPGALYRTPQGAVAYNKDKCTGCKLCVAACPFNIPRYDEKDKVSKCNMCAGRVAQNMQPACAKTCPTGAVRFGERDMMIEVARNKGYEKIYGEKDLKGLGALYAFKDPPRIYGMEENPAVPETVVLWHQILKPFAYIGLGGAVFVAALHYVAVGPKKYEEKETKEEVKKS